jgi:hypothetical protein
VSFGVNRTTLAEQRPGQHRVGLLHRWNLLNNLAEFSVAELNDYQEGSFELTRQSGEVTKWLPSVSQHSIRKSQTSVQLTYFLSLGAAPGQRPISTMIPSGPLNFSS